MFSEIKSQIDKSEKTIIHHQDEIVAALKSIQGSAIFTPATQFKKRFSERILSMGSKLCLLCLDEIQYRHTR
jgi:hypothetical protein